MRRLPYRRLFGALSVMLAVSIIVSAGEAQTGPKKGGVLRIGMIGEPPTLDQYATTAVITREIGIHMFEGLYALDAKLQPVPLLAEGHDVLDGGKRYVIRLRKDVKFHNGKALGSADVVASLRRWEEVIDASGDGPLKEYVGTGPFRFVEHKPDRHIKLARFDGYAARPEPTNGLAGQRVAYLDELYFLPVPDYATRQAGIQTGEYGYIQQIKPDQYDRIRSASGVEPVVLKPYGWATIVLNAKLGLMTDKRLRQAIQAALDVDPMMLAGVGHKDFYRVDPGLFFQETAWHSKVGAALYNQRDKDKARRLLKEAGYGGQPVRWLVTTEYEHHYKPALVAKSQLEEIGFKIDLQVSDWATVVQRRNKAELWDAYSTAFVLSPEPTTAVAVLCEMPGWWCNPEKDQLLQAMGREPDFKKRYAMWEKVQTIFYADATRIRLGDYFRLDARRKDVQGFEPGPYMHFWNVWLAGR